MELVKSLGANRVIDYTKKDFTQQEELYDVIYDAVGKLPKSDCKRALAPNGTYISVHDRLEKENVVDLLFIKELVEAGKLKSAIDRTYPLEKIVKNRSTDMLTNGAKRAM